VNELQMERLTNLVTNPYTWLFLVFAMSLGYILQYIRRFYPNHWQEAMAKEEACTLEFQKKPEMKLVRKIIQIGFLSMLFISYILAFHLLKDLENPLTTFRNILYSGAMIIAGIAIYFEYKIKKDKSCKDVIVGYKFIKMVGIIEIVFILVMGILYLLGYIK
jgi:hypothetical protein